jgi:hypothetical protein
MKNNHFLFLVVLIALFSSCKKDIDSASKLYPGTTNNKSQKRSIITARATNDATLDYTDGPQIDDYIIHEGIEALGTPYRVTAQFKYPNLAAAGFPDIFYIRFQLFQYGGGTVITSEMFPSYTTNEWSYTHEGADAIMDTYQGNHEVNTSGTLLHTTSAGTTEYWIYTTTIFNAVATEFQSNITIMTAD